MARAKVFGIGFQKTGTSSLGVIFDKIGYKTAGYKEFRDLATKQDLTWQEVEARAMRIAADVDSVKDTPWPLLYKELDTTFPGSKFIHVVRNTDAWLTSATNDFQKHPNAIHKLIYGSDGPLGDEDTWRNRYDQHNADVEAYFAERPEDYLQIRLEDGITFEKVCSFLGEPLVGDGSPHVNTRRQKKLKTLLRKVTSKI